MAAERDRGAGKAAERLLAAGVDAAAAPVAELEALLGRDAETDRAVVAALAGRTTPEAAEALRRVETAAGGDKELRREARRALYRLRQKGVAPADAARGEPAPRAAALGGPAAEAWLSPFDARGDRILWLVKPRSGGGGIHHLTVVVNEPEGLRDIALAEVKRKQLRALRDELGARHGLRFVEVDWRYAEAVAAEGYERARARGRVSESSAHYPQLRAQLFPTAGEPVVPSLRPALPAGTAADLAASGTLLDEEDLRYWHLPELWLGVHLQRYRELRDSPIVVDRAHQMARLEGLISDAVGEIFAGDMLDSWLRRLEETAYFLARTGRVEAATRAVAAADRAREAGSGRGVPFFEELGRRSFALVFARDAEKEREQRAGSVLVTPDDLRAEQQARARGVPPRGR